MADSFYFLTKQVWSDALHLSNSNKIDAILKGPFKKEHEAFSQ